ncbi:hypothetical protein Ddye_021298 [Dipteronia dyeriana]|uniref:RNase H type-1 domain-containing protein n=1 Tax=Dipteronia dyeriana TaxID=168575 RepID=A0AAD9U252_9ROSI|nr:hypothetical protein Ddye_021298 [Dipteronia dyeriana]
MGMVIRDSGGRVKACLCGSVGGFYEPQIAEAKAILHGFPLALETGLYPAILESDALSVVNLIKAKEILSLDVGVVIHDILELVENVGVFSCDCAPRLSNKVAHGLAKIALRLRDLLKTPQDWYEGKLTIHDHFDVISHIDDALNRVLTEFTDEDRCRFMASRFGHFLTMHWEIKFLGGIIYRLLLRELHHNGPTDEIQFMLGNQSVRFLKVEFYLITGLRFGSLRDTTVYAEVENDIHQQYFPEADEISLEDIRGVVTVGEFGEAYDAVKLCFIYMLNWILIGVDESFKIPVWQFRLVEDLDEFNKFPWGAHVYKHSIYSFNHTLDGRRERFERHQRKNGAHVHTVETYNIYGLSHALLIFAFEVIPDLGKEFGTRRVTDLSPRILNSNVYEEGTGAHTSKERDTVLYEAKRGGSLYVEEDRLQIPPPVPDQTTFGWNSGTEGGGFTDRTNDNEGSESEARGLRPNDSEGYQTNPRQERHRHRRVRFTTPGHATSTGDSRGGIGNDEEVS